VLFYTGDAKTVCLSHTVIDVDLSIEDSLLFYFSWVLVLFYEPNVCSWTILGVLSGPRFVQQQGCEGQTDCACSRKGWI
jgi:hypothetical protein